MCLNNIIIRTPILVAVVSITGRISLTLSYQRPFVQSKKNISTHILGSLTFEDYLLNGFVFPLLTGGKHCDMKAPIEMMLQTLHNTSATSYELQVMKPKRTKEAL